MDSIETPETTETETTPLATESADISDPLMASLHLASVPTPAPVPTAQTPQPEPPVSPPAPAPGAPSVTVGRIVLYTLTNGPHVGENRPAIVVRVWTDVMVNLQVFTDGPNDGEGHQGGIVWATSVAYDDSATPAAHTWRWPPRS
jgi:hypothetical protein